jgi:hypothetical protein
LDFHEKNVGGGGGGSGQIFNGKSKAKLFDEKTDVKPHLKMSLEGTEEEKRKLKKNQRNTQTSVVKFKSFTWVLLEQGRLY